MSAPLRIRSAAAPRGEAPPVTGWMERLVKLVPSEILAVYLAGRPHAEALHGGWPLVCLALLLAIRVWGTHERGRGPQWGAIAIAAASFVIWVLAMDGRILGLRMAPDLAALLTLVWVTAVPVFYRGDLG